MSMICERTPCAPHALTMLLNAVFVNDSSRGIIPGQPSGPYKIIGRDHNKAAKYEKTCGENEILLDRECFEQEVHRFTEHLNSAPLGMS